MRYSYFSTRDFSMRNALFRCFRYANGRPKAYVITNFMPFFIVPRGILDRHGMERYVRAGTRPVGDHFCDSNRQELAGYERR